MTQPFPEKQELLETPFGPTYVKTIGSGPSVFVIHGGPGFDSGYLVPALETLARKRTLIFYDQPGCGKSPATGHNLTPIQIFHHFRWLSHRLSGGQPVGAVAHSWGALVLIASQVDETLATEPVAEIYESLLINPVPVSASKYSLCAKNLLKRIPLIERFNIFRMALFEHDGAKIMESLLPYYVEDINSLPSRPFPLNKSIYKQLSRQLRSFNYALNLNSLTNISVIIGMRDFITLDLVDELLPHISSIHKMRDVAHFPFWEAREEFEKILMTTFN